MRWWLLLLLCLEVVLAVEGRRQGKGKGKNRGGGNQAQTGGGKGKGKGKFKHMSKEERKEYIGKWMAEEKEKWNDRIKNWRSAAKSKGKRRKEGDNEVPENAYRVLVNGKQKEYRGLSTSDKPDLLLKPELVTERRTKTTLRGGKKFGKLAGKSRGPKADGMTDEDFDVTGNMRYNRKSMRGWDKEAKSKYKAKKEKRKGKNNNMGKGKVTGNNRRQKRAESYVKDDNLWPSPYIKYMFGDRLSSAYHSYMRRAFDKWEEKSCLVFTEVSSPPLAPEPYILIDELEPQSCHVVRMGINKNPPYHTLLNAGWCKNKTLSLAHEVGHALGLTHTQKRVDRDQHIRVYTDFLPTDNWKYQFELNDKNSYDDYGIPYYYDSLMHYGPTLYLHGEEITTICALDPLSQSLMGQREQITHQDYALVNKMYCEESCVNRADLISTTFDGSTLSQTLSGRVCQKWTASKKPHSHWFTNLGDHNYCRNPNRWHLGPWCYTTAPDTLFEPCVASCETLEEEEVMHCEGYCHNGGFFDSTTCNCLCPKATSGDHCETLNLQEKYAHADCGGKIELTEDGAVQGIESPGYGSGNYGNNQMCKWWIKAPSGKSVAAEVENFHLEKPTGDSCSYDYLEILKSICPDTPPSVKETRYCGQSLDPENEEYPYIVKSDSEDLIITFSSDRDVTDEGFKIQFSVY